MTGAEDDFRVRLVRRFGLSLIGMLTLVAFVFPAITVASGARSASRPSNSEHQGQAPARRWAAIGHRKLRNPPKLRREIVGGARAIEGTDPWLAYIQNVVGSEGFLCTGTVVAPNLVLTAGHCAEDETTGSVYPASGFAVVTGSLDYTDTSVRQVSGVSQVIVYPLFNPVTVDGDAALLVLSTPTTAPAIALAPSSDTGLLAPGSSDVIAGWGETIGGDPTSIPTALQWAPTVAQSFVYCGSTLGSVPFDPLTEMCTINAPSYDTGTCFGDSGGPLIANDLAGQSGTPTEIGITSRGVGECDTTYPDIFTRVDTISSWVQGEITALPPPAPPPAPPPPPPRRAPLAGRYRGKTRQAWAITLRVGTNQRSITALTFSYGQTCQLRRRHVAYRISELGGGSSWRLNKNQGLAFSRRFTDNTGAHYRIDGTFNTTGYVTGTFRVIWHTRRYGTCDSGTVRWHARRTGN